MKIKSILMVSLILAIITIGAVSASEDIVSDDSLAVDEVSDDSIEEVDDSPEIKEEALSEPDDEAVLKDESDLSFTDLFDKIESDDGEITLENDYKYNSDKDSNFTNKTIDKTIRINGKGHTIDGNGEFSHIAVAGDNVILENIIFKNFNSKSDEKITCSIDWYGDNGVIDNCTFESFKSEYCMILVSGFCENLTVSRCNFTDNTLSRIFQIGDFDSDVKILFCNFRDNVHPDPEQDFIVIYSEGPNTIVTDCTFDSCYQIECFGPDSFINNGKYDFLVKFYNTTAHEEDYYGGDPELGYIDYVTSLDGNITILFNGTEGYNKAITHNYGAVTHQSIRMSDLSRVPSGLVEVAVILKNENFELEIFRDWVNIDYNILIYPGTDPDDLDNFVPNDVVYSDDWSFSVMLPKDVTGKLSIKCDDKVISSDAKYSHDTYPKYSSSLSLNGLSIGAHKIIAILTDDSRYFDKTFEHTFYVIPKINVPSEIYSDEDLIVTLNFPNSYNGVVEIYNGKEADFYDENGKWHSYVKNELLASAKASNGVAKVSVKNLKIGYSLIVIKCTGDGEYETYDFTSVHKPSQTFTATPKSVYLKAIAKGTKYKITLKSSSGKAIVGKKITVKFNGKTYKATTNAKGVATVTLKATKVGSYKVRIISVGDTVYYAASKTVNLKVIKEKSKLTAKKKTFKAKAKSKKYSVTLKSKSGKAIAKVKVTIKVNKKLYTAKTNAKGKATFNLKKLTKKGKYTATVKFAGSKYFNKTSKKVKITVKK